MNVLALYDIHGNLEALDAVLADPRAADPDVVLVGGDTVPGAFARETLARLEALTVAVHWVRGNGERESLAEPAAARLLRRVERPVRSKRRLAFAVVARGTVSVARAHTAWQRRLCALQDALNPQSRRTRPAGGLHRLLPRHRRLKLDNDGGQHGVKRQEEDHDGKAQP